MSSRPTVTYFGVVEMETVSTVLNQYGDQVPVAAILQTIREEQQKKDVCAAGSGGLKQPGVVLLHSSASEAPKVHTYTGGHPIGSQDSESEERRRLLAMAREAFPSARDIPYPISWTLFHGNEHVPSTQADATATSRSSTSPCLDAAL